MRCLVAAMRPLAGLLVGLALAMPQPARAELRGKVHLLVNPEAPRTAWRRVPLPLAYVVVSWSVTVPAPAHAITTCRYSELARSGDEGEYVIEGPNFLTARLGQTTFSAYSRSLELVDFPYGGSPRSAADITMARSTLGPEERLSRLAWLAEPPCIDVPLHDPHGLRETYLRGLLDEARSLRVESPPGRSYLQSIEGAVRRVSGLDKPGPIRAVIVPSSGSIQSDSVPPGP